MKIKDLYGKELTVTDTKKALQQTSLFKGFRHVEPNPQQVAADDERQAYWTDLHGKLLRSQSASIKH